MSMRVKIRGVKLPFVDYKHGGKANFIHVRLLDPDVCQEGSERTIDPGRIGHTELVICRPFGKETTTTQAMLVQMSDWLDDSITRAKLKDAMKKVKGAVCVAGLSDEDRKRFPELACGSFAKHRIFVKPEGENVYKPTPKWFRNIKEAQTFANVETVAGMGEDYIVITE